MLRTDLPSHRRSAEPMLVAALRDGDPLALAETCSRTLPVAYAVARRLLPANDVESLLLAVYADLWAQPPADDSLERHVRARTAALGLGELRDRGAAPAVPSVCAIAEDLPAPDLTYLDTTERTLATLDDGTRRALLLAHDLGVPSSVQDAEGAGRALTAALLVLADPDRDPDAVHADVEETDATGRLADWMLGLLPADDATVLAAEVAADADLNARVQTLRRGRERIEGLPPTPDLCARLVAAVLTHRGAVVTTPAAPDARPDPAVPFAIDEADPAEVDPAADAEVPVAATEVLPAEADTTDTDVSTEDLTDVAQALGTDDPGAAADPEAPQLLSALADDEAIPSPDAADPYAALRDDERPPLAGSDDDPYAPLREWEVDPDGPAPTGRGATPVGAASHEESATSDSAVVADGRPDVDRRPVVEEHDDDLDDLDEHDDLDEEPSTGRPAAVRLLQIIGVLLLIVGGIGVGLLIGQLAVDFLP